MRIAHQDLLFRLKAHLVKGLCIVAVAACALRTTEPVVSEALAVEFEAARLATIAGLVHPQGSLSRLRWVPHRLHQRCLEGSIRVILHVYIVALDVDCLRERGEILDAEVRVRAFAEVLFRTSDGREGWDLGKRACISFVSFGLTIHL